MVTNAAQQDDPADESLTRAILSFAASKTGLDLASYRRSTVERRLRNRMLSAGVSRLADYYALVRSSDEEPARLIERITIKVSRFYRNGRTFDRLRNDVVPALATRRGGAPLRVWSAGCGYGEEAYTLAMLLDAAGVAGTVTATDVDPFALAAAAVGRYAADALVELPPPLAARYVEAPADGAGGRRPFGVLPSVARRVVFGRHDLMADPVEIASYDLVLCRNVLIYLRREVQAAALRRLRAALADGGVLCLGEAEWPAPSVAAALETIDARARLFRAVRAAER